ncbi:MAG TPA: hypothetical protein VF188_09680, partial [Longimicrobiales bacterium]
MASQAQHTPSAGAVMENTYYKVLVGGRSCHGGDCEYALPMQREDGTWEPGEWMPPIEGDLQLCAAGYHLTREPARWWQDGAECYAAEWDGDYVGQHGDKIAVRRCRLLRRLDAAELAQVRVFLEGSHEVSDGYARAYDSARVRASGSAQVEAYDSAQVVASDSAQVVAYGSAQVRASGSAQVVAYDSARVVASDSAQVVAYGSARVEASGSAQVEASGSAQVVAYDSAQVEASDSAQVVAYGSAQVVAYGSAQVRAYGSARVVAYGSARVRAYDSARVRASGSAQVEASDSAQVVAHGSAQVRASGSAQVEASGSALVHTTHAWGDPTITVDGYAVWVDHRHGAPVVHAVSAEMVPVPTTG